MGFFKLSSRRYIGPAPTNPKRKKDDGEDDLEAAASAQGSEDCKRSQCDAFGEQPDFVWIWTLYYRWFCKTCVSSKFPPFPWLIEAWIRWNNWSRRSWKWLRLTFDALTMALGIRSERKDIPCNFRGVCFLCCQAKRDGMFEIWHVSRYQFDSDHLRLQCWHLDSTWNRNISWQGKTADLAACWVSCNSMLADLDLTWNGCRDWALQGGCLRSLSILSM